MIANHKLQDYAKRDTPVKLRLIFSPIVFVASYFPLSMILLAQNYEYKKIEGNGCWEWVIFKSSCLAPFKNFEFAYPIFLISLLCFLASICILKRISPKIKIKIESSKHIPSDLMNYTLPYVVSFMSIDYQETGKFVGFLVFMLWMFWITHASGQIIANPMLTVLGWKFYEINYRFPSSTTIYTARALSKVDLPPNKIFMHSKIQKIVIIKEDMETENDRSGRY